MVEGEDKEKRLTAEERRKMFQSKSKTSGSTSNLAAKELNLATILITTAVTFFFMHLPRVLTSLYEAVTIHQQLHCSGQEKDFLPLWFLYCIAAMNTLLVLNASSNILIYIFAGVSFRAKFLEVFRLSGGRNV